MSIGSTLQQFIQHNVLITLLSEVNGSTFISIDTETSVPVKGGKKNPFVGRVTKTTTNSNVMIFTNKTTNAYENMVHKRLVQEGKDPNRFELGERIWGERIKGTPFVEHNGNLYVEVIFLRCGEVKYLVDGVEYTGTIPGVDQDKVEAEQGGLDNKVIIRTYSLESIKAITINKQRYVI